MKKHLLVTTFIIILPFALMLLGKSSTESLRNIGQLTEFLYLSPGLIAQDELFGFQKDIGLLPTNLGRFLVVAFYLILYWGVVFIISKKGSNGVRHS